MCLSVCCLFFVLDTSKAENETISNIHEEWNILKIEKFKIRDSVIIYLHPQASNGHWNDKE